MADEESKDSPSGKGAEAPEGKAKPAAPGGGVDDLFAGLSSGAPSPGKPAAPVLAPPPVAVPGTPAPVVPAVPAIAPGKDGAAKIAPPGGLGAATPPPSAVGPSAAPSANHETGGPGSVGAPGTAKTTRAVPAPSAPPLSPDALGKLAGEHAGAGPTAPVASSAVGPTHGESTGHDGADAAAAVAAESGGKPDVEEAKGTARAPSAGLPSSQVATETPKAAEASAPEREPDAPQPRDVRAGMIVSGEIEIAPSSRSEPLELASARVVVQQALAAEQSGRISLQLGGDASAAVVAEPAQGSESSTPVAAAAAATSAAREAAASGSGPSMESPVLATNTGSRWIPAVVVGGVLVAGLAAAALSRGDETVAGSAATESGGSRDLSGEPEFVGAATPMEHPDDRVPVPGGQPPIGSGTSAASDGSALPGAADAGESSTGAVSPPPDEDEDEDEIEAVDEDEIEPAGDADEPAAGAGGSREVKRRQDRRKASQLLADARKANLAGKSSWAYRLASQSYRARRSHEALQLMGVAACKMGSERKARAAYSRLPAAKKTALKQVCSRSGLQL